MPLVLEYHSQNPQDERKEIQLIIRFIILSCGIWQCFRSAIKKFINETDAAGPIAITDITKALQIVLLTSEVPHEIPPIHYSELVGRKIFDVICNRRVLALFKVAKGAVQSNLVSVITIIPHSRKKMCCFHAGIIQI